MSHREKINQTNTIEQKTAEKKNMREERERERERETERQKRRDSSKSEICNH